jgi:P-type E1-E2 ATPase
MISGDNATTAIAVGYQLGIPAANIIAGVLPSEKADMIRWLQSSAPTRSGKTGRAMVAMVGDGINDSPALSAADAGIAIGSGSDVAISSAKFVLVSSNLHSLLTLITLSRTVFRRVKFNFAWALVYNVVLIPIAAGVIYPVHGHPRLNPVWASLAMALSSLSVVSSSLIMKTAIPIVGFRDARKAEQR